jgi:ABC-type thiamin/hydroxymethylpyrimidine transport system permease subunit/DMSO/TMAO reductase YedYZ molybdopterin-dependent catalytic subunit
VSKHTHMPRYYFDTRDLLMMAVLAALGGVSGTYINTIGDLMQSVLGFPGTTQWAAGLHVLWVTLAMGLVGKTGAGTVTGILKGFVELLSGNTHGILVLLINIVAGLLVDIGFLPFRRKDRWLPYAVAGGLASMSNVIVFQLFAALPVDVLAYGAMFLVASIAALSGVAFAGVLAWMLLNALRTNGVVKDRESVPTPTQYRAVIIGTGSVITLILYAYLRMMLQGPPTVAVTGAVATSYAFSARQTELPTVTVEATLHTVPNRYTGYRLRDILDQAAPHEAAALVLVEAVDGYAFFITMDEVQNSDTLILAVKGEGKQTAYDIVGAESSKAWVRSVAQLTLVQPTTLSFTGALGAPGVYAPAEWQSHMDSASVRLRAGSAKLQGTPLGAVVASMDPAPTAETVIFRTATGDDAPVLPLSDVRNDDELRIFTVIDETGIGYAIARMSGEVLAEQVETIEIR